MFYGSGSKKTYDQCVELLASLINGDKVWIICRSPQYYKDNFFKITQRKLNLKKIKGHKDIYQPKLALTNTELTINL